MYLYIHTYTVRIGSPGAEAAIRTRTREDSGQMWVACYKSLYDLLMVSGYTQHTNYLLFWVKQQKRFTYCVCI